MRFSTLFLLPLLVSADTQEWLDRAAGWFETAKSFAPHQLLPEHVDAGAAQVSAKEVQKITIHNWQQKLAQKPEGPEEWLIFVTGGNKTCHGNCEHIEAQWNRKKSVPLLVASKDAPKLGYINCDKQHQLCTAWAALVPSFWHFWIAQKGSPQAPSPLHIASVNFTTVTPQEIVAIQTEKKFLQEKEYVGAYHPIDGWLSQSGLLMPLGYFLWLFGMIPSWLFMITISFFSRQYMAKRMQNRAIPMERGGASAAAAAAPAPAPAAAKGPGGRAKPKRG